jgi:glutamate carboxypeptidase
VRLWRLDLESAVKPIPPGLPDAAARLLEELVSVSSPSGDDRGVGLMAGRLGDELEARGFSVEIEHEPDVRGVPMPILVARGPEAGSSYLLLVGHMDTVLPACEPRRVDRRLYGTGAIDMKGGFAAFLGALDLLAAWGLEPPRDLLLVAVPDEESSDYLSRRAMGRLGGGARGMWVLEPGRSLGSKETVVTGRRGLFEWTLQVDGRSAHAGLEFWAGRSALQGASAFCAVAESLSRQGRGPTVNVARMVAGDRAFVENLRREHAVLGTSNRVNVVPDRAVVQGEVRFFAVAEGQAIGGQLQSAAERLAGERELELRWEMGAEIPPFDPESTPGSWSEKAVALAAARGWELVRETDRGGVSFPNLLPDPSAIPILDGLGPVGDGMHTRNEHVLLSSLERRMALLADLLAGESLPSAVISTSP